MAAQPLFNEAVSYQHVINAVIVHLFLLQVPWASAVAADITIFNAAFVNIGNTKLASSYVCRYLMIFRCSCCETWGESLFQVSRG